MYFLPSLRSACPSFHFTVSLSYRKKNPKPNLFIALLSLICKRRGEEFRQASKHTPNKIALIPVLYMNKQEMHPIGLSTDLSLFTISSVIFARLVILCSGAGVGPLPNCRFAELTDISRFL